MQWYRRQTSAEAKDREKGESLVVTQLHVLSSWIAETLDLVDEKLHDSIEDTRGCY